MASLNPSGLFGCFPLGSPCLGVGFEIVAKPTFANMAPLHGIMIFVRAITIISEQLWEILIFGIRLDPVPANKPTSTSEEFNRSKAPFPSLNPRPLVRASPGSHSLLL